MAHLPLWIDLDGVRCGVIGAGRVAERRIVVLLRSGARVRVVAPIATRRIRALSGTRRLAWRRRVYRPDDLKGVRLVVAATADPKTNRAVARDARRRGLFCNVVDDPASGSVLVPAVLRRGPLVVAVATGGESPALARCLRDRLAGRFGPEYAAYVRLVGSARRRLLGRAVAPAERERRYRRVLALPLLRLIRAGRAGEARRATRAACGAD